MVHNLIEVASPLGALADCVEWIVQITAPC